MDDVFIDITDAITNPGGLFQFSYVEYYIETYPFGWSVTRKEQDFKRLREYFLKKFPQFVIPPIIQNKLFESKVDKDTKKIYYQEFLREIMTNQELCACKYLEEFLSINDYDGFREVRRLREKEPSPKSLKTYSNIEGKSKLTIQCQNTKILNSFDTFFINRYEQNLKELKLASDMIHLNSIELSNSIKTFGDSLESLSDLFSECGFDDKIQFYNDLRCVSKAYEDSVLQQAKTL